MITALRAFSGGHCRQLLALIDRRTLRWTKFPAVFLALHHAREGWVLVDTGYGACFHAATDKIPHRFYRWTTPVTPAGPTHRLLQEAGICPEEVGHVVVTHFHADHVGGLAEFPDAQIHYHAGALEPLQHLSAWRQVRAAFLPDLIPPWLPRRACPVAPAAFSSGPACPFPSHDLFGDGSVLLITLLGHAPGHLGVLFTSAFGRELYAADAFWRDCQLHEGIEPTGVAMALQWDAAAYRRTVAQLRELSRSGACRITACHDPETIARLNSGDSRR